jgi:hypothetical protein
MRNGFVDRYAKPGAIIRPELFTFRKSLNRFFLPNPQDLPTEGMRTKGLVFDFGFNPGTTGLAAYGTENVTTQIDAPFLIWGIVGFSNDATGPGNTNSGFLFQGFHAHKGLQRRMFQKHISQFESAGSAQNPFLLHSPYFVDQGDSLEIEVKNQGTPVAPALTSIQVVLWGGEIERPNDSR